MERLLKRVIILLILVLGISLAGAGCPSSGPPETKGVFLPKFQSEEQLVNAFRNGIGWGYNSMTLGDGVESSMRGGMQLQAEGPVSPQYSTTNIQVAGVDEADVVKTDGQFIYALSGNSLCIVAAYPPEDMRLLSRVEFEDSLDPVEMFVNGDRLAVFAYSYVEESDLSREESEYYPGVQLTVLKIYDISDRDNPRLVNTIEHEGSYLTSRMIDGDVYVVLTSWPPFYIYEDVDPRPEEIIPLYRTVPGGEEPGELGPACDWSEVEYFEPGMCTSFLSIISLSLEDGGSSVEKREIAGNAECVYASPEHLYVTAYDYGRYPLWGESPMADTVSTSIHKFRFDGAAVGYLASSDVPGTVLNQFSMDEWNGYFRIATTGFGSQGSFEPTNNVYVLDPALNITGRLEGLAPGETIYSARFMGNRGYLVTFEQIDPFFVIDLSDPANPRVLGELKIPGYSDYLHPYDENHIIGVGINAVEADPGLGDFSWFQGMKIALFDVSDVSNPREMHKVEIGDRGTDSYALRDHKAFLFDQEKELLVLPILLAELSPEKKASDATPPFEYGEFTFQGAYVFDLSLSGGFDLRGRITHMDDNQQPSYDYYYGSGDAVERSLYIEDALYTVSQSGIKANDLESLEELVFVSLEQ
jgi:inhibitor of cysteine peptidase